MVPYFHFTCIQFCLCHKVPFSFKEVRRLIRAGAGVIGDVLMSLASSTSLNVFWGSNYELRNNVDCSYGCLEGPGIFLILICACGEREDFSPFLPCLTPVFFSFF